MSIARRWNETKARSTKTEIKKEKKRKIRHGYAMKCNDALSKVTQIKFVAELILCKYLSNHAIAMFLDI